MKEPLTLEQANQLAAKGPTPTIRNLAAHVVSAHVDVRRAQERLKAAEKVLAAEQKASGTQ